MPLVYWDNFNFKYPGGKIWRAGGVLFWITNVDSCVFVIIRLNPVKFSVIVSI